MHFRLRCYRTPNPASSERLGLPWGAACPTSRAPREQRRSCSWAQDDFAGRSIYDALRMSRQIAHLPSSARPEFFGGCEILAPVRETATSDLKIEQRIVKRDQEKQCAKRQEIQRRCHTHGCQRRCKRVPDPTAKEEPCESERSVSNPGGLEPARPEPGLEFRHRHAVAEGRRAHVKDAAIFRLETGVRARSQAEDMHQIADERPASPDPSRASPINWTSRKPAGSAENLAEKGTPPSPIVWRRVGGLPIAMRYRHDQLPIDASSASTLVGTPSIRPSVPSAFFQTSVGVP